MALLASEGFEGGTEGVDVGPTNSEFSTDVAGGGTAKFAAAAALFGSLGMELDMAATAAYVQYILTGNATSGFIRLYVKVPTAPPGGTQIPLIDVWSGGTRRAQVTMTSPAGKINLRSPANVRATGGTDWSGQWLRLEYGIVDGTQTLDIFAGTNVHGDTPSESLSGIVSVTAGFDTIRIGSATADTMSIFVDEFAYDDAAMPAKVLNTGDPGADAYVWDGSALIAADVFVWDGVALVAADISAIA